jgi:hypothetical protein
MKTIFLCYSRDDFRVKDALLKKLEYLERLVGGIIWHDGLIEPGGPWGQEILRQLEEADAAIFLVSARSLRSGFCQDVEMRRLLQRHKREGTPLFLFLLSDVALEHFPDLLEIQVLPRAKDGRSRPWNECDAAAKDRACTEFVRAFVGQVGSPGLRVDVRKLFTIEGREDFARKAAEKFSALREQADESLRQLTEACLALHRMRLYDEARHLAGSFRARPAEARLAEPLYRDILELLKIGFPEHPVHMDCIPQVTIDTLFANPDFAALLNAIRFTETDPDKAISFLEAREWAGLRECPLLDYAWAQCLRKAGRLGEAMACLKCMRRRLRRRGNKQSPCDLGCQLNDLTVVANRALGVAYRNNESFSDAEQCFSEGERVLPGVSASVAADFLYSYGYFEFERAYKLRFLKEPGIEEWRYKVALQKAGELFSRSIEHSEIDSAPASAALTRLPIVHLLMDDSSTAVQEFAEGKFVSEAVGGMEPTLSAINCRFAIIFLDAFRQSQGNAGENSPSKKVFSDLEKLFRKCFVPVGPLQCHAFDIAVILHRREGPSTPGDFRKAEWLKKEDVWLWGTFTLLQDASTWECSTKEQQLAKLRRWCEEKGLCSASK